jgi:hypothetical protein
MVLFYTDGHGAESSHAKVLMAGSDGRMIGSSHEFVQKACITNYNLHEQCSAMVQYHPGDRPVHSPLGQKKVR